MEMHPCGLPYRELLMVAIGERNRAETLAAQLIARCSESDDWSGPEDFGYVADYYVFDELDMRLVRGVTRGITTLELDDIPAITEA